MTTGLEFALTPLIGREQELRALEATLASGSRLITLLGPGGSGKTRLARELFVRLRALGRDAQFVDLVGLSDASLLPAAVAAELGLRETTERDYEAVVTAALAGSTAALVLDNLEELTGAGNFLAHVLNAAPSMQIVATSRVPLRIAGEFQFYVQPLELPATDDPADIEASGAGALFLRRARETGQLDTIETESAAAIAELCRRVDGLPLALELAAARTRILSPMAILRRLEDHTPGLLTRGGQPAARHGSLDAVLTWSIELLGPDAEETLKAVSICPGGFDLPTAQALVPGIDILESVDALAEFGLLSKLSELDGEPWYRVLETVRAVAQERLSPEDRRTHSARLAGQIALLAGGTREAFYRFDEGFMRKLDRQLDNIRSGLDWAASNDPRLYLTIAGNLFGYWRLRGLHREGAARLRNAIGANAEPSSAKAMALSGLAQLVRNEGDLGEVRRIASEGAAVARYVGDADEEVLALEELALALAEPAPEVRDRLRELLPRLRDPIARFGCLNALGSLDGAESGFTSQAELDLYREAAAALSGTPFERFRAIPFANLAQALLYRDRPEEALEWVGLALDDLEDAGPELLAWAHSLRATAQALLGRTDAAVADLRTALALTRSEAMGLAAELLVAAIAVMTVVGAPLVAARLLGVSETVLRRTPGSPDLALGQRLGKRAIRSTEPVAFELARNEGHTLTPSQAADQVLAQLARPLRSPRSGRAALLRHGGLSAREIEVLSLLAIGRTDQEIATELFISPKTASVHVSNAKSKLGLATRTEAALWARQRGLADTDQTG